MLCSNWCEVNFAGLADDSTADTSEINIPVQQDLGIIQQVDDVQDEENCVLENGDGLHFVPHKESKHRPYKVLSSSTHIPVFCQSGSLPLSLMAFN